MIGKLVVAFGLMLDAFGALGIAIPDLPPRYTRRIRRYTPKIRHYQRLSDELESLDDDRLEEVDSLEKIKSLTEKAWPAIRAHYEEQIRTNPNYSDGTIGSFNSISLSHNEQRGIVMDTGVRERPFNTSTSGFQNMIDKYIERWYRSRGWLGLMTGFTIQFIGTLLTIDLSGFVSFICSNIPASFFL